MQSAEAQSNGPDRHIAALDGLRGVAILLVLFFHLWSAPGSFTRLRLDEGVANIFGIGWSGVDLFFVLSGFLITGILLDAKSRDHFFRNFYARRFLRIFPVYYGFLLILLIVVPLLPAFRDDAGLEGLRRYQLWYWAYLYNVYAALHPITNSGSAWGGHLWSLAIEEQFYVVWPAIVLLCGRRSLAAVCAACMLGAPLLRVAILHGYVPNMNTPLASDILMPSRVDSLAVGALIALAMREPDWAVMMRRWAPWLGSFAAGVVLVIMVSERDLGPFSDPMQIVGLSALAVAFGSLVAMLVLPSPVAAGRAFAHPVLTFFGRHSYALYVFHLPIALQFGIRVRAHGGVPTLGGSDIPGHLIFVVVVGSICVTLAWLSWHLYEKQFLKLKRYFPYRTPAPPPVRGDEAPETALASP